MDRPLAVAISAIISNNKILLIKRVKDGFVGKWSLPGGKVKIDEHVSQTAVREVFEETGIEVEFLEHLGFVSEHQIENENIKHVILHVCKVNPLTNNAQTQNEGEVCWFSLDEIEAIKEDLIPSDFQMIEKMVKSREKNYYDCVIEITGDNHNLKKFE